MLLENLVEEEQGADNHPELWLRFAESLGASKEEVRTHNALPKTKQSVRILKQLAQSENTEIGAAALMHTRAKSEVSRQNRWFEKVLRYRTRKKFVFLHVHEEADRLQHHDTRSHGKVV